MELKQRPTIAHRLKTMLIDATQSIARQWLLTHSGENPWKKRLFSALLIMILICFIFMVAGVLQIHKGGWIILLLLGVMVTIEFLTRRHERKTYLLLRRLDELVRVAEPSGPEVPGALTKDGEPGIKYDPRGKTAVLLVNGFNGVGLHTLFSVIRLFGATFTNFIFLQIGVLDAKNLKAPEEVARKKNAVKSELERYVTYMRRHGYYAMGYPSCGTDVVDEIVRITPEILEKFPNAVFFGGQLVFPNAPFLSGLFHNYTIFAVQRKFYSRGIPVVILPIRVC